MDHLEQSFMGATFNSVVFHMRSIWPNFPRTLFHGQKAVLALYRAIYPLTSGRSTRPKSDGIPILTVNCDSGINEASLSDY